MMTQTHLLVAAAVLARPGTPRRNAACVAGALAPDLAILALFGWAVAAGIPQSTLWGETYWRAEWQSIFAIANAVPVYLALLGLSFCLVRPKDGRGRFQTLPAVFALAALLHVAGDLPLHHDDAHVHFWPLSDWRFISPLSYWDRDHHAGLIAPLEALFGMALSVVLFRRFQARWLRIALGVTMAAYVAVPAFFMLAV
ncbi:MAG: cobalamin biosynthesis protein CobQ [Pseudomonadota bacterium]